MKQQTVALYVGANNKTGKLEQRKAERIVAASFDSFTVQRATGHYKGKREASMIISVSTGNMRKAYSVARKLARGLKQESVAVQRAEPLRFIA